MIWYRKITVILSVISMFVCGLLFMNWIENKDESSPEIKMDEVNITVSIEETKEACLDGVQAIDDVDGDVSDSLIIENISGFTSDGKREVDILAVDSQNNIARATRIISYIDYEKPTIQITSPLRIQAGEDISKLLNYIKVTDCIEGDISDWVQQYYVGDSIIDTTRAGYYPMTFSVFNSIGDSVTFNATIEVYDATKEVLKSQITLEEYILYIEVGNEFIPEYYIEKITHDGVQYFKTQDGVLDLLSISNEVDIYVPGWYEVRYSLTSNYGETNTVSLLVCVEGS